MGIDTNSLLKIEGTNLVFNAAMVSGGVAINAAAPQTVAITIKRNSDGFYWNGVTWVTGAEPGTANCPEVALTGVYELTLTNGYLSGNLGYVIHIVTTGTVVSNFYFNTVLIETEVTKSLETHNLDHLMKTPVANNADMTVEVPDGTVVSNMLSKTSDTSTYVVLTDALEAIGEGNSAIAIWNVLETAILTAGSIGLKVKQGLEATLVGTVGAGTHTTTLVAASSITGLATSQVLKYSVINFTSGNNKGRSGPIATFNNGTGEIGIDANFPLAVIPVNGDAFTIT